MDIEPGLCSRQGSEVRLRSGPEVRKATPMEIFNVPIFENPPMLDVRAQEAFVRSHIVSAVSVPAEDEYQAEALFRRIVDHDDNFGWMLQFPVVVVFDESTLERKDWVIQMLLEAIEARSGLQGFDGADQSERLLRRLAFQCRQILWLRHGDFAEAFPFCCASGAEWSSAAFFEKFGPLPRCALLEPRIYLAGRQVTLTQEMLELLGVTHAVVNGDALDVLDGTSGGQGGRPNPFQERPADAEGVRYLKCDVPDHEFHEDLPQVLAAAARFLAAHAAAGGGAPLQGGRGGAGLVRLYGQSRSASVVCAYLVLMRQLSLTEAWQVLEETGIQLDQRLVWWEALRRLPAPAPALVDRGAAAAAPDAPASLLAPKAI